jgi:hypothetical protein
MNTRMKLIAIAGLLISTSAVAITPFNDTYRNGTSCNTNFALRGVEPDTAGKFPVFIYAVGTTETFDNATALATINGMASRGYVAATVNYPNGSFGSCSTLSGRARCIFDATSANSVVTKLCARAKADCSKGIVVGGFSQGSVFAALARNFDTRVQAAYSVGLHASYSFFNLNTCVANGNRALPSNRLRIVDGEADTFGGGNATANRRDNQTVTGFNCGTSAFSCLQPNGSGWIMVRNNEVQDGAADHCYTRQSGGCTGSQARVDQGYATGNAPWQLNPNLDFLTQFTTP